MAAARTKKSDNKCFIFVIAGDHPSLVDAECDKLIERLISPAQRTTGLLNVDAFSTTAAEVMDELRTLPFLTGRRIVVLRNADKFITANRELLEAYFDNPSPTGILIMTVSNFDARTKLAKKLPLVGQLIFVSQPSTAQLPTRLRQYAFEAYAKTLQSQAAELLIELVGEDLSRLYGEIDKLAVFVADQKDITAEQVNSLVGQNRLYDAFDVIDLVIAGDTAGAADRLRRLFSRDKTTQYTFVGALAYHLRRLFAAKVMLQNGRAEMDIGKNLRIWHRADEFFEQVRKTSVVDIGLLIERLAQADYEIKTGRTTAEVAVEQLIMTMAAA
jgi:DNA polymerase-3 subunit delta